MTTCAKCGADVGDAAACPQCGQVVLSPQSAEQRLDDWRTGTAERPPVRPPIEPAPAGSMPGPPRFPLYADQLDVSTHGHQPRGHVGYDQPPGPASTSAPPHSDDDTADRDEGRGIGVWVPWVIVALVLVLVAVGGSLLLFAPGGDSTPSGGTRTSASPPAGNASEASEETGASSAGPEEPPEETPVEPVPPGDPVDVATTATARAPRTAPPNADAFGNRTTYVAANMLDGRPDTCWRMPGDGTDAVLTFRLAEPTAMTRVGLINGYAKNAVVGGRNLNWYIGNRRVLTAQWVFDDGTTVDQLLSQTKQMQTLDLGAPVTTSTVRLRLVSVSVPGSGRSARNYTAVSEVALVGTPSS
jgi:hypothetical protein